MIIEQKICKNANIIVHIQLIEHHLTIPHRKWRYNKYLINYDKAQYVKLPKCKKGVWQIHPLPLLCADGNGRGGGDYNGINENMVGIWAYDHN